MSEPPLRYRVATHKHSFKHDRNGTTLCEKVKELKSKEIEAKVTFSILEQKPAYSPETKRCQLCTAEKYNIIYSELENKLNKKTEIIGKCRHKTKFKLAANG